MDLRQLDTAKLANSGVELQLRHPGTGMPLYSGSGDGKTKVAITLRGADSPEFLSIKDNSIDKRVKARGRVNPSMAEERQFEIDMLVACTISWTGIELDGKPLECSPENVKALYSQPGLKWITDQVDRFVGDRGNFLEQPSTT